MTAGSPDQQQRIDRYLARTFRPEDGLLEEIRLRSEKEGLRPIQVGPMDALHLEVLTRAVGARQAVEIGTLGGYSGVSIARGLAPGGKLHTLELSPKHAEVARESFRRAGLLDQVEIHIDPAIESLARLRGPFDLVFIDADKPGYPAYLRWAAEHLKVGGLVLGDNTLAWGMIGDEKLDAEDREPVEALRAFNAELASPSGRFRATMLPTGEGLTMAVKIH